MHKKHHLSHEKAVEMGKHSHPDHHHAAAKHHHKEMNKHLKELHKMAKHAHKGKHAK